MALSLKPKYKLKPQDLLSFAEMGVGVVETPTRRQVFATSISSLVRPPRPYIPVHVNGTTTYVSKGQNIDGDLLAEIGSSAGGVIPDKVPQFTSRYNAIRTYESMANDDAAVDVSLRASKMPILAADFFIEPYDDSAEQAVMTALVNTCLFEQLDTVWEWVLEDLLRFYEYGVSCLECIWENREWAPPIAGANKKLYTMLKDLAPRPTPTLGKFTYDDNGRLLTVNQAAVRGDLTVQQVTLSANKLVVFSNQRKGGNLEGKSFLRTAYKHWYYKNQLYGIDGIQKERHGMGFPILTLPLNYSKADLEAAKELVRNIRTNQEGGAVLPPGFVLTFAELKSQPVNVMTSIDHHNGMIMLNMLVQFLLSGVSESAGGSRASSASAQDMFTKTLSFIANMICSKINKEVIQPLIRYNFDTQVFPKMIVRNIGETKDLQQWASSVANLLARNGITMDLETEQFLRGIVDFPKKVGDRQTPEANSSVTLLEDENVTNEGDPSGIHPAPTPTSSAKGDVVPGGRGGNDPKGNEPN